MSTIREILKNAEDNASFALAMIGWAKQAVIEQERRRAASAPAAQEVAG